METLRPARPRRGTNRSQKVRNRYRVSAETCFGQHGSHGGMWRMGDLASGGGSWYNCDMSETLSHNLLDRLLDPFTACLTPEVAKRLVDFRADAETQALVERWRTRRTRGRVRSGAGRVPATGRGIRSDYGPAGEGPFSSGSPDSFVMDASLRDLVRRRAANRCEYCRLPQAYAPIVRFHVEHIRARQHEGGDDAENLSLACPRCNAYKGPNLTSIDPQTRRSCPFSTPAPNRGTSTSPYGECGSSACHRQGGQRSGFST